MKRRLLECLALASGATAAATAAAHHSYAEFDRCRSVTLEGEVERVLWAQPHVVVWLQTASKGTYRIEWQDMRRLARAGIHEGRLARGDALAVTGSLHRDAATRVMTLISSIRRDVDGWHWSRPAPVGGSSSCSSP